jgi:hypothetical protein
MTTNLPNWDQIQDLQLFESNMFVFVFGSNLAGRHGKGAAKAAMSLGATYGQGVGASGKTYAIPTKDKNIQTISLEQISDYILGFEMFAKQNVDKIFIVTEIGCGLAGYTVEQIAPLFYFSYRDIQNIVWPPNFLLYFDKLEKQLKK